MIAAEYPFTGGFTAGISEPNLGWPDAVRLTGIMAAVDAIPTELLMVSGAELANFVQAKATLTGLIQQVRTLGNIAQGVPGRHLTQVRCILQRCPDRVVPAAVSTLSFLNDADLQDALRADMASVEVSLREADWKPATVMAGSVIEALLLWAVLQKPRPIVDANVTALVAKGAIQKPRSASPEYWDLHQFIEIAAALAIIKADTATQARLAKDFRNFVHPGKAARLQQKCDRGTAYAAMAALQFVIRDLS